MSTDVLSASASTWSDEPNAFRLPPELATPSRRGPIAMLADPVGQLRGLATRFRIRQRRAQEFFAASRNPERGLPVAHNSRALEFVRGLLATRKGLLAAVIGFNVLAATAGLVVPRMLGDLVDDVAAGTTPLAAVDAIIMGVAGVVVLQSVLTFAARRVSAVFGYDMLAAAREEIVRTVLRLPLGRVESASSGDLLTRITSDVSKMSESVRWAFPQLVMSLVVTVLTVVAMVLNSWFLALPLAASMLVLVLVTRSYLRRAMPGYITESGSYSQINSTMTETVEGARTVEALGLAERRVRIGDDDIEVSNNAERYTMALRNLMFIFLDIAYQTPLVAVVLLGTWGYANGWVTIGAITAAAIYVQLLVEPLDRLIQVADRLQIGLAATTRLLGIAEVPQDRTPGDRRPVDNHLVGRDLRFAYREGVDVLHGVDLDLRIGERLAIVGPSGSGKSTLGRLLAGINGPRTGSVRVGGVELMQLPLQSLRTEVALVTQEHHVFVGTVRDNIVLARDEQLSPEQGDAAVLAALSAVDALDWVERLPRGLDTMLGHGRTELTPAQAQQVALARLVVADPHTLVLDEATSLIDPRTARHLEGSMAALLSGRTVVAIAHRLHTAHDADRIAVVIDGRIAELGSHDELIETGGEYARLWHTWRS
ncbi:ABC transporter ATP-binding protein [Micropruina sonneratiae]|uniref:ABC transporter ATP-binding protein n=1 Tax=Micropruina sonneratiae TaxID=2986940 RepID=UPI002227AFF7|nr:ABC transporter ATP-binding protein [Micropruina sp. KQZ13P-5]MCW3159134.1 ABC transporter ATP-binding protein/permease [Micropruina sp. KQZ13P-5]